MHGDRAEEARGNTGEGHAADAGGGGSDGGEKADRAPGEGKAAPIAALLAELEAAGGVIGRADAFTRWLGDLQPEDFEPTCAELLGVIRADELPEGQIELLEWLFEDSGIGHLLFEHWARRSPDTLEAAMRTEDQEVAAGYASVALPFLYGADPRRGARILGELRQRGGEEFESEFDLSMFTRHLFSVAEAEAVAFRLREGEPDDFEWLFSSGVRDPQAIMPLLGEIPDGSAKMGAVAALIGQTSVLDPELALALLDQHAGAFGDEFVADLRPELEFVRVRADPAARLDFVNDPDTSGEVFLDWFEAEPEAALAWAQQNPDQSEGTAMELISESAGWLPFDLMLEHADLESVENLSVSWMIGLSDDQLARLAARAPSLAARELYRRDPQRAIELQAAWPIADRVAADPDRRSSWFEQQPEEVQQRIGNNYFQEWAEEDPRAAFEAAEGNPRGEAGALKEWLEHEDADAIYRVHADRIAASGGLQRRLAESWAAHDPQAAAETILADGLDSAVVPLVGAWVRDDSIAASEFIREHLQPGEQRDRAVILLVRAIMDRDPEAAHEWAETIGDEGLRQGASRLLGK